MIGGGATRDIQGPPVRLAIQTFKNQSFEPNLEFKYTQYVRNALRSAGMAEFTENQAAADFILEGTILSVTLPSLAFSRTQTQESRVQVAVGVTVKDQTKGKVRWTHRATSTAEFYVGASPTDGTSSGGLQFNRVLQDRAVEQAGRQVAEDIADRFFTARIQGKFERVPQPDPPKQDLSSPNSHSGDGPSSAFSDQSLPPSPILR